MGRLLHLATRVMATACLSSVTTNTTSQEQAGPLEAPELQVIGEERIGNVSAYAKRVQAEAEGIFGSDPGSDWAYYGGGVAGLAVYSRPVQGSGVEAVRSEARVPLEAGELFALLTSDAGFAIIDPNSAGSQHIGDLAWRDGRAEETLSFTPLPWPASKRSTLAASFIDSHRHLLVTKSILDDRQPPGADGCVRAFNSFALLVEPLGDAELAKGENGPASRLAVFDTVDLRGSFSTFFTNHFLKGSFCQDIQKRLYDHLQAKGRVAAPALADFIGEQ